MKYGLLLLAVLFPLFTLAQKNTEPYARDWARADSLINQGLPQSAEKIVNAIYAKARAAGQTVQVLKAQLFLMRTMEQADGADTAVIRRALAEAALASFPIDAIWHSVAAQLYWNYYQGDRYRILNRTALAGKAPDNLQEWDAPQFFRVIGYHYLQSIKNDAMLRSIRLEAYEPVIERGIHTRNLRPTLYDLLAFRVLAFFENDEKEAMQPAYRFELDDPQLLAPAELFARKEITTKDSTSLQHTALLIYQHILSLHLKDAQPDALIDADLHRIGFVYANAVFADKKMWYEQALKHLAKAYPDNATAAEATYRMLASQMNGAADADADDDAAPKAAGNKRDLRATRAALRALAVKFPNSEGGTHAVQLAQSIAAKSLTIQSEETALPGQASKVLVSYKNVDQAYIRIVKVDGYHFRQQLREERDTFYKKLLSAAPVAAFSAKLPGAEDYEQHSTEVKIDALPLGAYAIIISAGSDFAVKDNALGYVLVQCTDLAMVKTEGNTSKMLAGYVLHRKSGLPVKDVQLVFYRQVYKNNGYQYTAAPGQTTGGDGGFRLPSKESSYNGYSLSSGDDNFYSPEYFYLNRYDRSKQEPRMRTFFFTDRSIYRPGQTVYFKGIVVKTESDQKRSSVVADMKTTVTFYDVNGQKSASLDLKTNEFGSFTGSFTAPQGVLTGQMQLRNESGSQYISVEEYKRPKFAVRFDTLKGAYALNEPVSIKGFAKAYAGNSVDGAAVKYTVKRQARWPYWYDWWHPQPASSEQEITHGTAETDAGGAFTILFLTQPDRSVDSSSLPVFTYSIDVDVTDASGETRSGHQSISAGYRSLQISAAVPAKASLKELGTLTIRTENLNGIFVAASTTVSIHPLQSPGFVPRARLWPMPDKYTIDETTFRQTFPLDEYKHESKPQSWKEGNAIWEKTFTTDAKGELPVPAKTFSRNGWYVISIRTKDKNGMPVDAKSYVQVWDVALNGRLVDPLVTFTRNNSIMPGEAADVAVVTGFDQLHLLQVTCSMSKGDVLAQADVKNEVYHWSTAITEADRGGLALQWLAIKDNRLYTAEAAISVPWTNKDLQVSWETHRDKLQPGEKETWTMKVTGPRKEKIAAEMVAGLYDASLDAFSPHSWGIYGLWPSLSRSMIVRAGGGFEQERGIGISGFETKGMEGYGKVYDALIGLPQGNNNYYTYNWDRRRRGEEAPSGAFRMAMAAPLQTVKLSARILKKDAVSDDDQPESLAGVAESSKPRHMLLPEPVAGDEDGDGVPDQFDKCPGTPAGLAVDSHGCPAESAIPLRKNLKETAFFYPQLKTDAEGNVRIEFTMPEALTEWKFMALAHTKEMQVGQLTGSIKTQKDLMVQPGLPRFFRQGDDMAIATKIANLSTGSLSGTARLEIVDAATGKSLNTQFRLVNNAVSFTAQKDQSTAATWSIHIPESCYEPVSVRITASAGSFTDGEENMLPVLTNRMLVTETMPLWMNGAGSKTFTFDKLAHSGESKTLSQYGLTLEYTSNPAWYAVQALPYLMEYPYECAEQTFNRYYANALAAHIIEVAPRVKEIFKKWENGDTAALQSNLDKNEALKSALLEETPWVLEAKTETEQKHRIALLFQSYKLQKSLNSALSKLQEMQLPDGGFPWFRGMQPDQYITQYIVAGMGRLAKLGVKDNIGIAQEIIAKAIPYMDREITARYEEIMRLNTKPEQYIDYSAVMYLYARSFSDAGKSAKAQPAYDFFRKQAQKYWAGFNPYMKGLIALALNRSGDLATPKIILQSLKETSSYSEELGRYWSGLNNSWWWYEAPVEAQSSLIECFTEAGKDESTVNELKRWLLKNKQATNWHSTRATADACYALLLAGSDWLSAAPEVTVRLGEKTIKSAEIKNEAGTGYFKVHYEGKDIQPQMGNVSITLANAIQQLPAISNPSWGAVYWQYFEDFDKIISAATPLALKRQIFIERNTDHGPQLEEIKPGNSLKVGDKVTIRIVLQSDRDMEYLHLKDARAACFEPVDVLSGYKYQDGLGYYQSTKDASSNFFISYLRKGTYVFTYSAHVTAKGNCSAGIATIQCMYAPEFTAHSEGVKVKVE